MYKIVCEGINTWVKVFVLAHLMVSFGSACSTLSFDFIFLWQWHEAVRIGTYIGTLIVTVAIETTKDAMKAF